MGWKHIVVEGYCLFQLKSNHEKPKCCKLEPGDIGLHCLDYNEKEHRYCPFFGYGAARASLVLIDKNGEEVLSKVFCSDENVSNERDWLRTESNWINKWKDKMKDDED